MLSSAEDRAYSSRVVQGEEEVGEQPQFWVLGGHPNPDLKQEAAGGFREADV